MTATNTSPRPDGWAEAPVCFIDTETDGVHPGRKPWEIAAVRRDPDGTVTELDTFVEIDLSTADPFGLRVGRFYDRHPLGRVLSGADASMTGSLMTRLGAAMVVAKMTHGAHILGAVPTFDTETLDPVLREHQLLPAWHYHIQCVETLAIGFLAAQGVILRPPYRSDEITAALGLAPVPAEEKHTAMGDVRWAMRIYDRVMAGADLAVSAAV